MWFLSTVGRDDCLTCRYCEALGFVGEEKNAFTGLAFTVLGLGLSLVCSQNSQNLLFLVLYSLLGPGLMVMHLYQSTWAEHVDSMSLVIFLSFYYYHVFLNRNPPSIKYVAALFVLVLSTILEFSVDAETRGWSVTVFIVLVVVFDAFIKRVEYSETMGLAWSCCCWRTSSQKPPIVPPYVEYAYVLHCVGLIVFLVGAILQIVGRYSCDSTSVWQHHAAWHVFAAVGLGMLFVAQDWIRYPNRESVYSILS